MGVTVSLRDNNMAYIQKRSKMALATFRILGVIYGSAVYKHFDALVINDT
jgi:hypothetical protein